MAGGKKLQVEAPDDHTVVITFPAPFAPGIRILDALPILPRHKLEAALKAGTFRQAWGLTTPLGDLAGLGPFVVSGYQPGQRLTFSRNERYFDKACQLAYANSGPNTNGSQFFITEVPAAHLNARRCPDSPSGVCGYVRFGEGVCGCDLVAKIAALGNDKTTLKKVEISSKKPTCK